MRLAIIPARGGSKRIPKKNIREFLGKPMIAWAIETAAASNLFDEIWVSTDDAEIAEIATRYGARVPFVRPEALSDDYATTLQVMQHAAQWAHDNKKSVSDICCLYATTPLLQANDLIASYQLLSRNQYHYVFSAAEYPAPIFRAFHLNASDSDTGVSLFFPEHENTRSQDLPQALHDAGMFYWGRLDSWLNNMPIFSKHAMAYCIPRWRVCDIDTLEDWQYAELIAQAAKGRELSQ